jgi:hypothetical protein
MQREILLAGSVSRRYDDACRLAHHTCSNHDVLRSRSGTMAAAMAWLSITIGLSDIRFRRSYRARILANRCPRLWPLAPPTARNVSEMAAQGREVALEIAVTISPSSQPCPPGFYPELGKRAAKATDTRSAKAQTTIVPANPPLINR